MGGTDQCGPLGLPRAGTLNELLRMSSDEIVDLLVVGGGINGAGIARDAAGRGHSVVLCEQGDLGGATSSASTKLIHGGLRYLEHYRFRLVRESLAECETLLRLAPHAIRPLRFILPLGPASRPAWLIRLGLMLYDSLSRRVTLPGHESIDLARHPAGAPLVPGISRGFAYSDCRVDDSRLVVLNALAAAEHGARILTRTQLTSAEAEHGLWSARLVPIAGGAGERLIRARILVNATGPWVARFQEDAVGVAASHAVRLVRGSHIVVPWLFDHDQAYIFQHTDNRVFFAIPYEDDFTLIGTTEVDYEGDPAAPGISDDETSYLCRAAQRYFKRPPQPADVVWSFAGVRPLHGDSGKDASGLTRDYLLDLKCVAGGASMLSVYGGKITTYRTLAEAAMERLKPLLGTSIPPWTGTAPLPGGDLGPGGLDGLFERTLEAHPWLPPSLCRRLTRAYGTRLERLLNGISDLEGLGQELGACLYEAEARYLMDREWARTADDILWRRTKLGLKAPDGMAGRLDDWMAARREEA